MGRKPLGKVSTQWTADLAYAVGLIASDGSLSKNGRHINLTSKDLEQVENFRNCLGLTAKIGTKGRGGDDFRRYYQVQFGDVLFYRWLLSIGLTPAKSLTIGALVVPDHLFFDFLRGSFDGDGSAGSFRNARWPGSLVVMMRIASASREHLEWIQSMTGRLANAQGAIMKETRSWVLRYGKLDIRRLYPRMYHAPDVPCLSRKRVRLELALVNANADVAEQVDAQP